MPFSPMADKAPYTYLDWAATAPLSTAALEAMEPYLVPGEGSLECNMNANSLHGPGRRAFAALEQARKQIASCLGASRPSEVVFTSGATESDNAAILGMARAAATRHPRRGEAGFHPRVVTSAIEHEAVLAPVERLSKEGFEVVFLKPDRGGFVSSDAFGEALGDSTVLASIQMANSEIGAIQNVAALAEQSHEAGVLFHTDATQAFGKEAVNVETLGVDALSLSAHKLGGPKGVGALYLKARTPFEPQMLGGGQEGGLRSTTQNVCGIAGFAAALAEAVSSQATESARQRMLRDGLYRRLGEIPGVVPSVEVPEGSECYLPNIVSVMVAGVESETLILRLDARGFAVSGGSACSSRSLAPSAVLKALGHSDDLAYGALRVSFGNATSAQELDLFVNALTDCLESC